jgi:UDP:flavonoid glycosyltransferase YjiC (YdhE family)
LIFAEAVTLAHVARPIALARLLRELGHDVCIAAAPAADRWLASEDVARVRIDSIAPQRFLRALARGSPAYDGGTLERYVEDDLRAIAAWPPDIVIGDFRLSLYISARRAGKPYGAIANAYWSRRYWTGVDAPDVTPLAWLPRRVADVVFRATYPAAFALHALPFHRVCRRYGIKPPGLDIRDVYTASDATAFADVEAFYEPPARTREAPAAAHAPLFIGPLAWEPPNAEPLPTFPAGPPIVFVALGSSGRSDALARVLRAVAAAPVRCVVATGMDGACPPLPANCIHFAPFVPYAAACAAASLVICNGGAPAVYAALGQGRPVVAVPAHLDQVLDVRALRRTGAVLRAPIRHAGHNGFAQWLSRQLADHSPARNARSSQAAVVADSGSSQVGAWMQRLVPPVRPRLA